jgi:hypothetical protein
MLVCDELKVAPSDAISKCRDREFCEARQVTSYILKKYTKLNLYAIAHFLNYASHASVLRDVRQIPDLMKFDKKFERKMEPILWKARQYDLKLKAEEADKKRQEEYDRMFSNLREEDWYNNVFYAESLMLPV